jgi:hypothetical protein
MNKPPLWFTVTVVVALLWNLMGLLAIVANLNLSAADLAALPAEQQALHRAQPGWSVVGSVIAVVAGTLGCVALVLRKRWALWLFVASLVGIAMQDAGLFIAAGSLQALGPFVVVMQGLVLGVGVLLLLLSRRAMARAWIG